MKTRRGETYRRRHEEGQSLRTKYAQLHADQLDDLTPLARELQDAKRPDAPRTRLTENTLIRIAVDLLLELEPHLYGDTEEEIRENLLRQVQASANRK